jgi:hypothetical protein
MKAGWVYSYRPTFLTLNMVKVKSQSAELVFLLQVEDEGALFCSVVSDSSTSPWVI